MRTTLKTIGLALSLALAGLAPKAQGQNPFRGGERLKYNMSYGFIDGGAAEMRLMETQVNGKPVLYARAVGYTTGVTHAIYNIYDVYSSVFDPVSLKPYRAIRDVEEGRYKRYNVVTYDHQGQTLNSQAKGVQAFEGEIFDVVSGFYYARRELFHDLVPNQVIKLQTYFADEFWNMEIIYKGIETIETELGDIECMKFLPLVEPGRVFDREDDLKVWISNDRNRIPVRIQMDLIIGSFVADLVEYENLVYDLEFED